MPFKSKYQAKFLFAKKPEIAEEFAKKTKSVKALPEKKTKQSSKQAHWIPQDGLQWMYK